MNGKIILELNSPVTQTREAVAQLITYFNHGQAPAEMPAFFRLTGEMVLVQNAKRDAYYITTPKECSCPAKTYNPGKPCKHQRKYFPGEKKIGASIPEPVDSIRPTGKWIGGYNGPVEEALQEVA
jgi:hypothetical protein